jgi:integrase
VRRRALTAWAAANKQIEDEDSKLRPIGLHEARHTCASIFIAAGVNAKALSAFIGHSSVSITLDRYGHLMPGSEEHAAELVDAYLEAAERQSSASGRQKLRTIRDAHGQPRGTVGRG